MQHDVNAKQQTLRCMHAIELVADIQAHACVQARKQAQALTRCTHARESQDYDRGSLYGLEKFWAFHHYSGLPRDSDIEVNPKLKALLQVCLCVRVCVRASLHELKVCARSCVTFW